MGIYNYNEYEKAMRFLEIGCNSKKKIFAKLREAFQALLGEIT